MRIPHGGWSLITSASPVMGDDSIWQFAEIPSGRSARKMNKRIIAKEEVTRECQIEQITMAEAVGFEPTVPFGTTVFKTASLSHSDTPPRSVKRNATFALPQ